MNLVDVNPFDELVVLINNLSDEKSKRILLSKAAEVYGYGGKAHIVTLTGTTEQKEGQRKWLNGITD